MRLFTELILIARIVIRRGLLSVLWLVDCGGAVVLTSVYNHHHYHRRRYTSQPYRYRRCHFRSDRSCTGFGLASVLMSARDWTADDWNNFWTPRVTRSWEREQSHPPSAMSDKGSPAKGNGKGASDKGSPMSVSAKGTSATGASDKGTSDKGASDKGSPISVSAKGASDKGKSDKGKSDKGASDKGTSGKCASDKGQVWQWGV